MLRHRRQWVGPVEASQNLWLASVIFCQDLMVLDHTETTECFFGGRDLGTAHIRAQHTEHDGNSR